MMISRVFVLQRKTSPRRLIAACILTALLAGCSGSPTPTERGQRLIDQVRAAHNSDSLDNAVTTFTFRDSKYSARLNDGRYRFARRYRDSAGRRIVDVLSNDSLYRTIDGVKQALTRSERLSLETTVNSVVYFALLPYDLQDTAVQPRYLGPDTIDGEPYHEVEVTFQQDGGGRDWQDRFVYWIHRRDHTMDYLAYYFHTSGGGSRFRDAVNVRRVNGIRFADYINYSPGVGTLGSGVEQFDELYADGRLQKVSEVRLDSIRVRPLPD